MASSTNDESEELWLSSDNAIQVNFNKLNKFVCVQHPANVQNVDKALETLGGVKNIVKTCNNPSKRLELKWRPGDIYCKPTYGNRVNRDCLVMTVKRRRRKQSEGMNEGMTDEGNEYEYKVDVLGIVDVFYEFKNMVDFQYLPTIQNRDRSTVSILDKLRLSSFVAQREYLDRVVPLFMPPVIFSRMDLPAEYLFRQNQCHSGDGKELDSNPQENLIGTARRKRTIFTIFVGYHDPSPTGPMEGASAALHSKVKNLGEAKQVIEELFARRPIWSKNALRYHLDVKYLARLKFVLPLVSYFMTTGPWRVLWVKFGYDPRKDLTSKKYQTLDFRRRQRGAGDSMPIGHKRSSYSYSLPTAVNKAKSTIAQISTANLDGTEAEKTPPSHFLESTYKFRANVLPPYRQMFYQVCDIEDGRVQALLKQNDKQETTCDEKEGWCLPDFNELARDVLYQHVETIIAKTSFSLPTDASRRSRHVVAKMREFQLQEATSEEDYEYTVEDGEGEITEDEHDDANVMDTELMDCV